MEPKAVIRDLLKEGVSTEDIKKNLQELGVQNIDQLIQEAKAEKEAEENKAKQPASPYLPPAEKTKPKPKAIPPQKQEKTRPQPKTIDKKTTPKPKQETPIAQKTKQPTKPKEKQKNPPAKKEKAKPQTKQKQKKEARLVEFKPEEQQKETFTEVQLPFFSSKEEKEQPKETHKEELRPSEPPSQDASAPAETVEQVAQTQQEQALELASIPSRVLAKILDVLILFVIGLFLSLIPIAGTALQLAAMFAYSVYFIGSRGQTPGKMLLGIKVVKTNGSPATYVTAIVREIGELVSTILLFLGYALILADGQRQGLHDKLAGTIVVKTGN